jgi:hypothetical protein
MSDASVSKLKDLGKGFRIPSYEHHRRGKIECGCVSTKGMFGTIIDPCVIHDPSKALDMTDQDILHTAITICEGDLDSHETSLTSQDIQLLKGTINGLKRMLEEKVKSDRSVLILPKNYMDDEEWKVEKESKGKFLRVGGSENAYRCDCGNTLFHHATRDRTKYRCNNCNEGFTSED